MSEQLQISNVRNVLVRLEETIIFAIIERAQFLRNDVVYQPNYFGNVLDGESLCGFMLRECECSHAKVRRYTSPDELPFFENLPPPILPRPGFSQSPLIPNTINFNTEIRNHYETQIVPLVCASGDDKQYGSSAVCDVACLQAISKRIHYGKFVAESKFRAATAALDSAIAKKDATRLMEAITDETVEQKVLQRVQIKAETYTAELNQTGTSPTITPDVIVRIYRDWIIPLNKQVQVKYLLFRATR